LDAYSSATTYPPAGSLTQHFLFDFKGSSGHQGYLEDYNARGAWAVHSGDVGTPLVPPACDNGADDDGDGLADLGDPGCVDALDEDEHEATLVCDDGFDNDGDGNADSPNDPGCKEPTWHTERPQCQDGLDNDGTLGTDFDGGVSVLGLGNGDPNGADPQCTSAWKNQEATVSGGGGGGGCGVGPELAPALGGLLWLIRRRLR
jgi:hypothetical protein